MDLQSIFDWVVSTSVTTSIMVLSILMIKTLIGNYLTPKWHYFLWFLVIIKLLIPVLPESPISIHNFSFQGEEAVESSEGYSPEQLQTESIQDSNQVPESRTDSEYALGESDSPSDNAYTTDNAEASSYYNNRNINIFPILWLLGVLSLTLYTLTVNISFWLKVKRNMSAVTSDSIMRLFNGCKEQLNISKNISVFKTSLVKSPTLFGFFKPKILLPAEITSQTSLSDMKYIFLHELSHIKQRDILINWITGILKIIHWFNPVIWYGFYRMKEDRELACDANVLSHLNQEEQHEYGRVIINLLERMNSPIQTPGMVNIINDKTNLKRRILMISKFKQGKRKFSIIAVLVIVLLGAVFLTNAHEEEVGTERGNTVGNIVNRGLVSEYEDKIFFSNLDENGHLYKKEVDGSKELLVEEPVEFINVFDGWIYYWLADTDDGKLFKIRTDGTDKTLINEDHAHYINVVDDHIYYSDYLDEGTIYKVRTDGSNKTEITDAEFPSDLNVVDNWIYYYEPHGENSGIHRIQTDGSNHSKLIDVRVKSMNVIDGYIYYSNNNGIFRVNTDGESNKQLSKHPSNSINVTNDYIFYTNESDGRYNIYRMNKDGSEEVRINDFRSFNLNIAGDKIYFQDSERNLQTIPKDAPEITESRERDNANREEIQNKLKEIAVDVLGSAPKSESELPWVQNTSGSGINRVTYDHTVPYAQIQYKFLPDGENIHQYTTEELVNLAEEDILNLLDKLKKVEDIDHLIDYLNILVDTPIKTDEFEEETGDDLVEIWRSQFNVNINGKSLAETDWESISVGELENQSDVEINFFN